MMAFGAIETSLSLLLIILVTIYIRIHKKRPYDYWKNRGVVGPRSTWPFGNFADIFFGRKAMCEKLAEIYYYSDSAPMIGFFAATQPILLLKDPELIKNVFIKDFNVFDGRGIKINETIDPLSVHLFNIDGERWRVLRQKLTPIFTSGKLRFMFQLMATCADNFENYLKSAIGTAGNVIECREIAARYTTDVIGCCAFGIDTKALQDENSIFRKIGREIFEPSVKSHLMSLIGLIAPGLHSLCRFATVKNETNDFFIDVIRKTIEMRKSQMSEPRNDFIDLLIQMPKDIEADGFECTIELLAAQAFVFFGAGFETSSTTISFALWELAKAPEIQERLRDEILEYERKEEGRVSYEIVNSMKYLDMVVKETLRKNPPATTLVRRANRDYTFPGTQITIEAGQAIRIPAYSLHLDPKYYPDPKIFDPERFTEETKSSRHPMVFLPFGHGPKNCIGLRFAYHQVKLGLIKILKNFRIESLSGSPETYEIHKRAIVLSPVGGISLKFKPL